MRSLWRRTTYYYYYYCRWEIVPWLQRTVLAHRSVVRHHAPGFCRTWCWTSGGWYHHFTKHKYHERQLDIQPSQTLSQISRRNGTTGRILSRRVAKFSKIGRWNGSVDHSQPNHGASEFAQFLGNGYHVLYQSPIQVSTTRLLEFYFSSSSLFKLRAPVSLQIPLGNPGELNEVL